MFIPNYGINSQQPGGVSAPVISGFAYPGETLASTSAGQWYVDGAAVTGETGTTFAPTIYDIGLDIHQENGNGTSNTLTCWHPSDVPQVQSCRVPWAGVLTAVGPDTPATVGQTVRRWTDLINGWTADQTTGANQPILREASGMRYVEADGSNDIMFLSGAELATFQNVSFGGMIVAGRDRSVTTGSDTHILASFSTNTTLIRGGVYTRSLNATLHQSGGRRLNNDSWVSANQTGTTNYVVICGLFRFSAGHLRLLINGSLSAQTNYSSGGGNSGNSASSMGCIFAHNNTDFSFGDIFCAINFSLSSEISDSDFSRLQRFAMLCMGGLYTGPDIPLVP